MNILFLIHVEEMFRQHFPDKLFTQRILRSINARKYDEVYCLCSDINADPQPIHEIQYNHYLPTIINWSWGYEKEYFDKSEQKWMIPATGHDYTWIPPEIRNMNLNHANIFVGGGSEYECLQDFLDILDHLNLKWTKIPGLVY